MANGTGIGGFFSNLATKAGPAAQKVGGFMEKYPEVTKAGIGAVSSIGSSIKARRAGGGGGGVMGSGRPDVDPNYMQYLNDIRRRRLAYQSGQAYAPERASLLQAFSTGARELRRTGGGTGSTIYGLRRMMAGVGAGLAQVKQQVGAPMESKLAELEGSTVQDITGRAMELDLLRQSKGEAQGAAAQTRGAISGSDRTSGLSSLLTKENIKGLGAFLSNIGKKKNTSDINMAYLDQQREDLRREHELRAENIDYESYNEPELDDPDDYPGGPDYQGD